MDYASLFFQTCEALRITETVWSLFQPWFNI